MKILHTADWQLGLRAAQAGPRAAEVRAERLAAVERVVDLALDSAVDLVVVAGDVFDHHEVSEDLLDRLVGELERLAPVPVALLPGNHDPLVEGGVWSRLAGRTTANLRLLFASEEVPVLPGVALYPCPLRQKRSRQDPTAWIPPRRPEDTRLRIGVAHGALDSLGVSSNFPIARERVELAGLDYLALGDWHGVSLHGRIAYPGTIEQTSFGEKQPGFVLVVELDAEREADPLVEQHRVGRFHWHQLEVEARDITDVERLESEVSSLGNPGDLLLRVWVRASGLSENARSALDRVEARLDDEVFFLDWRLDHAEVGPLPFDDGLLLDVDRSLADLADGAPAPEGLEDLADLDPEVLREARVELRRRAGEALSGEA